ncbi:uncharacterized protein BX664DRAFT_371354 [Halteromyces radiatus]|uniref:uncharacterized protein n=1 Tax=Halteromyces radiatus TaxID=101107 RepID=UPI0022211E74|nr:uncharacterized protein BX664DRAFT_371354 [Halteromyces radiatus]KAI8092455.1 hypothetical protein BX664DRAFT_371354 [Halteromyces radiatus]
MDVWSIDNEILRKNTSKYPPGIQTLLSPLIKQFATNISNIYQGNTVSYLLDKALLALFRCNLAPKRQQQQRDKIKKQQKKRHQRRIDRLQNSNKIQNINKEKAYVERFKAMIATKIASMKNATETKDSAQVPISDDTDVDDDDNDYDDDEDEVDVDDSASPAPTTEIEPSNKRLKKMVSFVKRLLFYHPIEPDCSIEELQAHISHLDITIHEGTIIQRIYKFLSPYVLPSVNDKEVDLHPLLNYPIVMLCNYILTKTGYSRFTRKSLPTIKSSSISPLILDSSSIYNLFCGLKFRAGGQQRGSDDPEPFHRYGFDVGLGNGQTITNSEIARKHPDEMFGAFFKTEYMEALCHSMNLQFDHRIIITNYDVVHLQGKRQATTDDEKGKTTKSKPNARKRKRDEDIDLNSQIGILDKQLLDLGKEISRLNNESSILYQEIKMATRKIEVHHPTEIKKKLVDTRQELKKNRNTILRQLVLVKNKSLDIRNEKAAVYNAYYGDNINQEDDSVSASNTSLTPLATTGDNQSSNQYAYIGCDPGLVTMLQTAKVTPRKLAFHLALSNRFEKLQDLEESIATQDLKKEILKTASIPIKASQINAMSHNKRLQKELNIRKKKYEAAIATEDQEKLTQFYIKDKWTKRMKRRRKIFKESAYAKVANQNRWLHDPNGDTKLVYFYGDSGRSTGLRIGGHLRRGHKDLIKCITQNSIVATTPEYRTSKLCCFCNQPTIHPMKRNKDQKPRRNLGTVICTNPDCYARKNGYASFSRDANACVNMVVVGFSQMCNQVSPPAFQQSKTKIESNSKNILNLLESLHPDLFGDDSILTLN